MRTYLRIATFVLPVAATVLLLGCGDDDSTGVPLSCQEITDACHDVDPGSGPIHDCHETAHDVGTDEACAPIHDSCIAMCEAAMRVDGAVEHHDGDVHDEDGGHEDHDGDVHDEDGGHEDEDGGSAPDAGGT